MTDQENAHFNRKKRGEKHKPITGIDRKGDRAGAGRRKRERERECGFWSVIGDAMWLIREEKRRKKMKFGL